jgi:hypothetical protein
MVYEKYKRTKNEITKRVAVLDDLIVRIVRILDADHGKPELHLQILQSINTELDGLEDRIIAHFGNCSENFENIDKMTDRVLNKTQYESCNAKYCPTMIEVVNMLDGLREKFSAFDKTVDSSRENTGITLNRISDQIADLKAEINTIMKSVVAVLSESLRDKR